MKTYLHIIFFMVIFKYKDIGKDANSEAVASFFVFKNNTRAKYKVFFIMFQKLYFTMFI